MSEWQTFYLDAWSHDETLLHGLESILGGLQRIAHRFQWHMTMFEGFDPTGVSPDGLRGMSITEMVDRAISEVGGVSCTWDELRWLARNRTVNDIHVTGCTADGVRAVHFSFEDSTYWQIATDDDLVAQQVRSSFVYAYVRECSP